MRRLSLCGTCFRTFPYLTSKYLSHLASLSEEISLNGKEPFAWPWWPIYLPFWVFSSFLQNFSGEQFMPTTSTFIFTCSFHNPLKPGFFLYWQLSAIYCRRKFTFSYPIFFLTFQVILLFFLTLFPSVTFGILCYSELSFFFLSLYLSFVGSSFSVCFQGYVIAFLFYLNAALQKAQQWSHHYLLSLSLDVLFFPHSPMLICVTAN